MKQNFALHRLGWQAFQDLCVALVEEHQGQPVQTFLPTNDAGRDGAFRGRWNGPNDGHSTIQCKFTSKEDEHLSLSALRDELPKARRLAEKGLADDYIFLTNCVITGESELKIKDAFEAVGVKCCRVFHRDWIVERIEKSAKLRMMVPRLYGLVDLMTVFDVRAYEQAKLILSQMGESLQKLVVTEAHRNSVRAISDHSLVLLLGSPATGKSTIGASLALGAADLWNSITIKSTSPEHLQKHIDPNGGQFFWIDDAWGSTQYQRHRTEMWNQVFPLMQGAMHKGTKFLITSRDYIWHQASTELKLNALPILKKSQVIIKVQDLSLEEKARILYNHIKLGNQNVSFRESLKKFLPDVATLEEFLPESARRLGSNLFTNDLVVTATGLQDFFCRPKDFLEQTIVSLSVECRAAIALIFQNGGAVRSPVTGDYLNKVADDFGVTTYAIKASLQFLNGSLLILAHDDVGPYWTYHHPTVSDAFASYLASSPELMDIYIRGAKPESLANEVVCAGVAVSGASVVVPVNLYPLLAERFKSLIAHSLKSFISYRAEEKFTRLMLEARPSLLNPFPTLLSPFKSDSDVDFLIALFEQGLLSKEYRDRLYEEAKDALIEDADDSLFMYEPLKKMLSSEECLELHIIARDRILNGIDGYVESVRDQWDSDYDPRSHFDELRSSLRNIINENFDEGDIFRISAKADAVINACIDELEEDYEAPPDIPAPQQQTASAASSLSELFRDINE